MSRPTLTEEQADAVRHPRGDVVVLASAGSGKTTVLTERYVTLVARRGLDPRRVAALTFTEKAAGEMRRRIAEAFQREPSLRARAADVAFAPISTIHGYGARLLREHALVAGVDPAFTLLDETSADELLEDALADVEARMLRMPGSPIAVLRRIGDGKGGKAVLSLHRHLRGLGHAPRELRLVEREGNLTEVARTYGDALLAFSDAVSGARLVGDVRTRFDRVRTTFPSADEVARGGFGVVRKLAALQRGKPIEVFGLPPRSTVAKSERVDLHRAASAAVEAILDGIAAVEIAAPLRAVLSALDETYVAAKRSRGALDFADLELQTTMLLERLAARGVDLPGRPHAVLVDEFQDINPVQARLIEALRTSVDGRRAERFAVGDPKQSIYRFRRADVEVMRAAWHEVGAGGQALLSTSFRTRAHLVAFHNAFFSEAFSSGGPAAEASTAEAVASDPAAHLGYVPLRAGAAFHASIPSAPPELLIVEVGDTGGAPALHEARAVATRIRALVDGGALRAKADRAAPDAPPRPLRWQDVAILLRSRTHLKAVERGLIEAGIPFHVGKGAGFYQAAEIEDLLYLLRVIHDPLDRYALAAFLTSPAVGATDADLLAVFGPHQGETLRMEPIDAARARPALAPAVAAIDDLRRRAAQDGLESLVAGAVQRFDMVPTALLQTGGSRRARNLEKAISIARRLDDEGRHGLFDLLRRISDLRDREVRESEAASGVEGDAVSVLTVHGSKGLEWPVVFLVCAGGGPSKRAGGEIALVDRSGAVALRLRDPLEGGAVSTGAHTALAVAENEAEDAEALRLLYVALTRAEERLVVSAAVKGRTKDGRPAKLSGAAGALWDRLEPDVSLGSIDVALGDATVRVTVEAPRPPLAGPVFPFFSRTGPSAVLHDPALAPDAEILAAASARWSLAQATIPSLGRTPYVASISAVLAFSRSPAAYYRDRLVGGGDERERDALPTRGTEREDPASFGQDGPDVEVTAADRRARYDEGHEVVNGVDRAALGRAVHLVLERYEPGVALHELVARAVKDEGLASETDLLALACAMGDRALQSAPGRAMTAALVEGRAVRREAAFHARVRFPEGEPVAGFEALLLKGTVDLWLDHADGRVTLHDFKTNAPSAALPNVEALCARYALQLQLYALAVERIVGCDVAGASLLLLDPAWSPRGVPVEVPVDVTGPSLLAARRLVRAFAVAHHEERFPVRVEDL